MFINSWYPAEESANLVAGQPLKVRMLGLQFVLWRDESGSGYHGATSTWNCF